MSGKLSVVKGKDESDGQVAPVETQTPAKKAQKKVRAAKKQRS